MGIRSDLDANFDVEIVDEFLDHYSMMIDSMEVMIIDLGKANMYKRSINELFRVFHNIKSASSYLKIEPMSKLAAFVESELEILRDKEPPINDETINWLLEVSDMFAAWQDDLKLDNELTKNKILFIKNTRYGYIDLKDLVAYITSGYPEKNFSIDLALALGENGVDTLELGVPFSDPVADGPAIERANQLALEKGFKFQDLLDISKEIAPKVDTLWMGYFNSFFQQNMELLLPKAKELGVNGLIIPDLPHEEALRYKPLFDANGLANISFVAPTDSRERIKEVVSDAQKFIYMVAYTGITGSGVSEDLQPFLATIKEFTQTPVYVGFGVNEKTAKEKVKGADGVIVGSAFINILLNDSLSFNEKITQCSTLAKEIKEKINS